MVDEHGVLIPLRNELIHKNNNRCVELSLSALCSISQHVRLTSDKFFNEEMSITAFLGIQTENTKLDKTEKEFKIITKYLRYLFL